MKVVFLGCTFEYGFGFGANITKVNYMAKGLTEAGATCVIHNGIVGTTKIEADQCVEYNGFKVTTYKQQGSQHLSWIKNLSKVYRYLKQEREKGKRNIAIVELDVYHIMLAYYIMLKLLGYKIVTISHEWGPIIENLKKIRIFSHKLFANTFGWFSDGILPISEYIIEKIKHFNKPYFKLPIMTDFQETPEYTPLSEKNFVYCASCSYFRIIKLIIDSYKIYIDNGGKIGLTLILSGKDDKIKQVRNYISSNNLVNNIKIKSKLPYTELLNEYANASALLIPLNPDCVQDIARFSQKIAEYLSSHTPIITNDVGEIKYYFTEKSIIKCHYSKESFAQSLLWVEQNPDTAKKIGENGYQIGVKEFDYRKLSRSMYQFFEKI